MFPPRGDYSQEQRQRKWRNPHHERMRIEREVSEDFPRRRIENIRGEARADCKSAEFRNPFTDT